MTKKRAGVIVLKIELTKSLSRKKAIRLDLSWDDMLSLPISGDRLLIDQFEVEVIRGPASDEVLLDQPSSALDGNEPRHWYCRYGAEWARVETLVSAFGKDSRYLSAQVLP